MGSHDPKTDHTSLSILVGFSLLCIAACVSLFIIGKTNPESSTERLGTINGCEVVRFKDKYGQDWSYASKCKNGHVAITDSNGNYILIVP
jgi:hypothetical protein